MKQSIFEKTSIKLIAILSFIFILIALMGSIFHIPHLVLLSDNMFYVVMLELIGVFFLIILFKSLYSITFSFPAKYDCIFAVSCFAIITIVQIVIIKYFEIRPIEDLNKVTNMAIDLVNGKKFTNDNTYFSMYTNNIPFTLYLSKYYKLMIHLGVRNYTMAGSLLGVFAINASLFITSLILKEIRNRKTALFFLVINVFNPLIYIWGIFFYTTVIAIPFMMLSIYLIIKMVKEKRFVYLCIETFVLTVVLYIGTQIRATTSFVLIAALLFILLKLPRSHFTRDNVLFGIKKLLSTIIISFLCFVFLSNSYQSQLAQSMDADYSQTAFPPTHWIMMGLRDNGGFNWEDEQSTLSFSSTEDKVQFNKEEIQNRLNDLGVRGLIDLAVQKLIYTWSDGSHDYPVIMRACHNYTNFHKYILGDKRDAFLLYCQIFNITLLLFLCIRSINLFRHGRFSLDMILYLTLFGGILFHLLWEANPKYSLNFMMLIVFLVSDTMVDLFSAKQLTHYFNKAFSVIGGGSILITALIAILLYPRFTKDTIPFQDMVQGQLVSNKDIIHDMNQGYYFYQSFYTGRAFNNMAIQVKNTSSSLDGVYQLELLNENQTVLYSTRFSPKKQDQLEVIEFNFDTILPAKATTYYLKVSSDEVTPDQSIVFCMANKQGYDVFPHGSLFINGKETTGDLAFSVKEKQNTTYTSPLSYFLWIGGILMIEFIFFFYYKKESSLSDSGISHKVNNV